MYKDFSLTYDAEKQVYQVAKSVTGRIIITNYDPAILSHEERISLQKEAETGPSNEIILDIRPGHPGGEYPLHGKLLLRSFYNVLTFIGRTIEEEPEYHVPPDLAHSAYQRKSSSYPGNPRNRQLAVGVDFSVALNGHHYAVQPETGYQWNRKAFSLLYQLFQMTVAVAPQAGPAITISK